MGLEVAILLMFGFTVLFRGGGPEGLSLAASFSPEAIASGAPGVAIMFAVASMFGFESTAIYSAEAKDAQRTVARATYLSVGVIAVFFSFISWMLVSYYGPSQVIDAAGAALESGDSTSFVLTPMVELFGPWAGITTGILLVTSLLAGIIAFHNGINRYLHSLALRGSMPGVVARTNRHRAPAVAARIQTVIALVLVAPFALLALDPVLTLFSWFSGLAVAALLVLYMLSSLAVVGYFRRERVAGQYWQTLVAPVLATVLLAWVLYLVVSNFTCPDRGERRNRRGAAGGRPRRVCGRRAGGGRAWSAGPTPAADPPARYRPEEQRARCRTIRHRALVHAPAAWRVRSTRRKGVLRRRAASRWGIRRRRPGTCG